VPFSLITVIAKAFGGVWDLSSSAIRTGPKEAAPRCQPFALVVLVASTVVAAVSTNGHHHQVLWSIVQGVMV